MQLCGVLSGRALWYVLMWTTSRQWLQYRIATGPGTLIWLTCWDACFSSRHISSSSSCHGYSIVALLVTERSARLFITHLTDHGSYFLTAATGAGYLRSGTTGLALSLVAKTGDPFSIGGWCGRRLPHQAIYDSGVLTESKVRPIWKTGTKLICSLQQLVQGYVLWQWSCGT